MDLLKRCLFIASFVVLVGGCRGYHPAIEKIPVNVPDAFSLSGKGQMSSLWWQDFDDKALSNAISYALSNNFTVRSAFERINKASALVEEQRAPLFPWLDTGFHLEHITTKKQGRYINEDKLLLSGTVSYEVDLWSRIRAGLQAAQLDLIAQRADYDTARISLSSQVANAYFDIVALKQEKRIIDRQIKRNQASLLIIQDKYRFGQTDSLDLLQQQQLVQQNISKKIDVEKALASQKKRLMVLMGRPPVPSLELKTAASLPRLPPLPDTGLPISVIRRRPDCMQAFLRLKAANRRLAVAVAEQYPRLDLVADVETDSSAVKDLFENWIATLSANILGPIFHGGALAARVKVREAEARELLNQYGQVVIEAIREVEDGLQREKDLQKLIENLSHRLELARKTSSLLKEKYLAGDVEYLRFLTSQLNVDELERQLVSLRLELIKNRIALYKAIAGPFELKGKDLFTPSGNAKTTAEKVS